SGIAELPPLVLQINMNFAVVTADQKIVAAVPIPVNDERRSIAPGHVLHICDLEADRRGEFVPSLSCRPFIPVHFAVPITEEQIKNPVLIPISHAWGSRSRDLYDHSIR